MAILNVLLALFAGVLLSVQLGVNNALRGILKVPIWAALASFVVGTCALLIVAVAIRAPAPEKLNAPAWMWTGGALGAIYVFLSVILVPRLGAATLTGAIIAGQLSAALLIDQFGWLRVPTHALSPGRIVGALFLFLGVVLIRRF